MNHQLKMTNSLNIDFAPKCLGGAEMLVEESKGHNSLGLAKKLTKKVAIEIFEPLPILAIGPANVLDSSSKFALLTELMPFKKGTLTNLPLHLKISRDLFVFIIVFVLTQMAFFTIIEIKGSKT